MWDTYRNLHQLMTLVYPERQIDMVRTMVDMYKEHGWLPKWELYGRETLTMEGDPSLPVIVDTRMKGLRDFDMETAYEAMQVGYSSPERKNLMRPDNDDYMSKGYVPLMEQFDNSVSHALEYYIADYALYTLAKSMERKLMPICSTSGLWDTSIIIAREFGTLRPILPDGKFYSPFDPLQGQNFWTESGIPRR